MDNYIPLQEVGDYDYRATSLHPYVINDWDAEINKHISNAKSYHDPSSIVDQAYWLWAWDEDDLD